ncbi:hypothetical protein MAHJHV54_49190 [Mycobacterium avium subsp. hominissuis]
MAAPPGIVTTLDLPLITGRGLYRPVISGRSSVVTMPGGAATTAGIALTTRIEVTGEPSYAMDICLSSRKGDHNHAGLVATAGIALTTRIAVATKPAWL